MWKRLVMALCGILLLIPRTVSAEIEIALPGVTSAVLIEPTTGTELCGIAADAKYRVAGLSKLPAILTLAQSFDEGTISPEAGVHVSKHAASISGPTAFLAESDTIPASELMKAAVMISAGDAIMALGEHAFGSEDVFVDNINATLRLAGLSGEMKSAMGTETTFSALELARLGAEAAGSETFLRYSVCYMDSLTHSDGRTTELVNANRLIRSYAGCAGLLTGSSPEDGYGGVFYAVRGGMPLVAVVLGAPNASDRFAAAGKLLDHGFGNYRLFCPATAGEVMAEAVPVRGGEVKTVSLVAGQTTAVLLPKSAGEPVESNEIPEYLTAPVDSETEAGRISYTDEDGRTVAEIALYPERSVASFGIFDILHLIAASYIGSVPSG